MHLEALGRGSSGTPVESTRLRFTVGIVRITVGKRTVELCRTCGKLGTTRRREAEMLLYESRWY